MNKKIVVSSPPRSGNNFLQFMINSYINKNKLDYDFCEFGDHDPNLLISKEYNKCLTVIRKPKDVFLSVLIFDYEENGFEKIDEGFEIFKNRYLNFLTNLKLGDSSYYILFDDLIKDIDRIVYNVFYSLDNNCPKPNLNPQDFKNGDHTLREDKYKSPIFGKAGLEDLRSEFLNKIQHISFTDIEDEVVKLLNDYPQKRIR
jgi:hypothetical protein